MPNWVQNEIIFENANDEKTAALIRELKNFAETEKTLFDFNKFIPMPESLNIEEGYNTDLAIAYYVTDKLTIPLGQTNLHDLIHNPYNDDWAAEVISRLQDEVKERNTEYLDKLYTMGKQYIYNKEHYDCYTWYEWNCCNWGTKWNACNPDWCLDEGSLRFQTAWSAPFPVIETMAEKYPELEFTYRWADEDIGNNCGEMWYRDGNGSDVDIEDEQAFAMSVWGYTEDDFEDNEIDEPRTVDSGLSIFDLI